MNNTYFKHYTTLHRNLKNLAQQFKDDGLYNVIVYRLDDGQTGYLFCGDSNYILDCDYETTESESAFYEVTEKQVETLLSTSHGYNAPNPDELIASAITYLDEKCLTLAKLSVHAMGEAYRKSKCA